MTASNNPKFHKWAIPLTVIIMLFLGWMFTVDFITCAGNDSSRYGTVHNLVDNGTFALEYGLIKTVDKIIYNNHIYSDKPLFLQVLISGPYWVLAKVFGLTFTSHYHLVIFLLNYFCFYSLNIFMFLLFYKMTREKLPEAPQSFLIFSSLAMIYSTMLFSYSVAINNHTPTAFLTLVLLFMLERTEKNGPGLLVAFLIGATTGTILNVEYIFGGVFGLSAFFLVAISPDRKIRWRPAMTYAVGALIMVSLIFIINYIAFGSPIPMYSKSHRISYTNNLFYYILMATFGFKGIYLYMPALLFIFPVILKLRQAPKDRLKITMIASLGATVILYFLVTNEWGGWSFGFRYLIPIIPITFYYIILDLRNWQKSFKFYLFIACILWGMFVSYLGAYNPWCISYEKHISGDRFYKARYSFMGNLLTMSFEKNPDSALSQFLIHKVFGEDYSAMFLSASYFNKLDQEMLPKTRKYFKYEEPADVKPDNITRVN